MTSQLLASDVTIEEEAPTVRPIDDASTTDVGCVGVSERGPFTPTLATTFDEWQKYFGGYTANNADAALAIKSFFDNGGQRLWFVRTVHYTDATDPTTKASAAATLTLATASQGATSGAVTSTNSAPYDLEPNDTLTLSINGGGNLTATFTATAAARESTGTENFALSNGMTLTVKVDQGTVQTITFLTGEFVSIGAATAEEVAAVINAKIVGAKASATSSGTKVTITSDKRGTGSYIEVTGGTANTPLNFATAQVQGTGNVANIDAVTFAETKTVVEAAVAGCTLTQSSGKTVISSNTTGAASSVLVVASSTADDEYGFDNATHSGSNAGAQNTLRIDAKTDGTYANSLSIVIAAASNGNANEFDLNVSRSGVVVERFPNVSMDSTLINYVVTMVNDVNTGSDLIKATDLASTFAIPAKNPAAGTLGPMTGGGDGLSSLADADFNGGTGVNGTTGLRSLDGVSSLAVLIVPGRATSSAHNAMVTYCEITRAGSVFAILDPPANQSASQMVTYVKTTAALYRLTEYAAIYWPRIKVDNPSKAIYGTAATLTIPPSGAIAGMYARTDTAKPSGVFTHPAGTEIGKLFGVRGLEMDEVKQKAKRELVFPCLINPISKEEGTPYFVDGARTLKDSGNFPTIGERRGVIFVEQSLKQGLAPLRHRNINDRLAKEAFNTTKAFLLQQTRNEAFASKNPAEAFYIDWGKGLNPASVKFARQVVGRIGLATSKPAEFVRLKVTPDTRSLQEELAAA